MIDINIWELLIWKLYIKLDLRAAEVSFKICEVERYRNTAQSKVE